MQFHPRLCEASALSHPPWLRPIAVRASPVVAPPVRFLTAPLVPCPAAVLQTALCRDAGVCPRLPSTRDHTRRGNRSGERGTSEAEGDRHTQACTGHSAG